MKMLLAGVLMLAAGAARAEVPAPVRVGNHPGFGRVVFNFSTPTDFQVAEQGDRVLVVFAGAPAIAAPAVVPRNVLSLVAHDGSATLVLAAGARLRPTRIGTRVVLDALDPPSRASAPRVAAVPAVVPEVASPPPEASQAAVTNPPGAPQPQDVANVPHIAAALPAVPIEPHPASSVSMQEPPAAPPDAPLRIPAAPGVGAAAFRRGNMGVVILDRRSGLDPGRVAATPGFTAASWRDLGETAILTVPLPPGQSLALKREPDAWIVSRGPATAAPNVEQAPVADGLALKLTPPGRVVTMQDPLTGQALLIGTADPTSEVGAAVSVARAAPGYALLPTWLGVAVEPTSDQVDLRISVTGFTLVAPNAGAAVQASAPAPTRRFDFPAGATDALVRRLQAQIASAALLPPRARGPERVAAAQTMLALGLATEAQALLAAAAADDPAIASDPTATGLSAVAALLDGRLPEADGLQDPRLDGTDEIALWRGVRAAVKGKPADTLAKHLGLVMAYPAALRDRLLPIVAEAAVRSGAPVALDRLAPGSPLLAFARALQQERAGNTEAALAAYDAIAVGQDQSDSVRATVRAAELRLAAGRITPGQAADILERQAVAWRGDSRESTTRLRVAELRTKARSWRAAIESLNETMVLFPNLKPEACARKADVLKALLASPKDAVHPLELVSLAGELADCAPAGPAGEALAGLLADKLVALDLPSRAIPVLQTLLTAAAPGAVRAGYGARLAKIMLDSGSPAKAEAALNDSVASDLSTESLETRGLLMAQARAGQGDVPGAIAGLTALGSAAADDLRATLLAKSGDWPATLRALTDLVAKVVPAKGTLSDHQQDILLRQASAAVQAGETETLQALRRYQPRLTAPQSDLFRTLTSPPVRNTKDLARAGREIALARAIPDRLQALTGR